MSAKTKVSFVCNECGGMQTSWSGKCSNCGAWNSLVEQVDIRDLSTQKQALKKGQVIVPVDLDIKNFKPKARIATGIKDIDEILGGGIVCGSVVLIAGQPGIGKSTLLLQLAKNAAAKAKVLYVSAEESTEQVSIRAKRLGGMHSDLKIATSTSTNDIAATVASGEYDVVIVDSIQTVGLDEISSSLGSVSQVTFRGRKSLAVRRLAGRLLL